MPREFRKALLLPAAVVDDSAPRSGVLDFDATRD